jgi:hypothetical protein
VVLPVKPVKLTTKRIVLAVASSVTVVSPTPAETFGGASTAPFR